MIHVAVEPGWHPFRDQALRLLQAATPPEAVAWEEAGAAQAALPLFAAEAVPAATGPVPKVPRAFVDRAQRVICHRDPARLALLYRVLWRITRGARTLLADPLDDDVRHLAGLERQVRRDVHKMHAFVRFRRVEDEGGAHWIAWHRPDHRIVEQAAPFFARRFPSMRWTILTPDASAHWDGASLHFGPGATRDAAPAGDALEELWRTYYRSTFNPARLNLRAMKAELPVRHWATLPEAAEIARLALAAPDRVRRMVNRPGAPVPPGADLVALGRAARGCTACPLHGPATRTVVGEGPADARLVLVGEQPGDQEDLAGRPFVGPAGEVLDEALAEAGLDRRSLYLTNAVKHFKFVGRGKRRLHQRPAAEEVRICSDWLQAELAVVQPAAIVCLGLTAARSLLGPGARLQDLRGQVVDGPRGARLLATWHPAAILRARDATSAAAMRAALVADLRRAASLAA
ncbi:UdgX family uracil-DNA binding protein [Vulgatibacter sp.]|uniref:UdgX family uracil-DNA binding protein n=1 Tax=Vulgatibacter sp. TaxID=1971226 RepID=UPI00356168C3